MMSLLIAELLIAIFMALLAFELCQLTRLQKRLSNVIDKMVSQNKRRTEVQKRFEANDGLCKRADCKWPNCGASGVCGQTIEIASKPKWLA